MVQFKKLNQCNANYKPALINRLCLLYKGGYDVVNNASLFLKQMASETDAGYEDRLKAASYLPFMSDIIDYYAALLFSKELSVSDAADADDAETLGAEVDDESVYKLFIAAADLKGNSLEEVLRKVVTDALIFKDSYLGIDFPTAEEAPINLLEEEVMQTGRPYLYYVDPSCVVDWQCGDDGNFKWVKLKSDNLVQENPLDDPMHQIEFKIWTMENGVAKWQLYRTKLLKLGKEPAPNDEIELVAEDSTSFREIPILRFCLPEGLSLGFKIAPICEDIYQRTSILVNGENRSVNAMRVVFLGEEFPAPGKGLPSQVQENPFRALSTVTDWESKGIAVLGANDKMEVIEAQGHAFKVVDEQINKLIETLKEVVHQMANSAASQSKSLSRSAASKQEDRHATEILLTAYGNLVRDFTKHLMSCISSARNESVVWVVNGLDTFNIVDREQLIKEAGQFSAFIENSKSTTFSKLYTEKLYLNLLDGTTHEEALQIRAEINEHVDNPPPETMEQPQPTQSTQPAPEDDTPLVGPSGHVAGYDGMHLQSGEHVDSQVVFDQLAQDYKEKDIQWVLHIPWKGPMEVPLSSIDFSNKDNWAASSDLDHVDEFVDKISNEGFSKPIILVNAPSNNNKMIVVDGHHRALAYQQINQPALAYVGEVGRNNGPWDKLHAKQVGSKQEKSNQEQSNQLVSRQKDENGNS